MSSSRSTPRPPVTIPMTFVQGMLSGVHARGLAREAFLLEAGIAPELLHQVSARVTASQYAALIRVLMERLDDECLGFLSRPLKIGSFVLITRSAISAETLEVAMRRVARAFRLLQDDVLLEPVRDGAFAGLSLQFTNPSIVYPNFLHECLIRMFWRQLAWLIGGKLPAVRFDFAFEIPAYGGSYGQGFPAPLRFDCQRSAFWFEATCLQKPVRRTDADLRTVFRHAQAEVILPRRDDDLTSARVRGHLQRTQPEWPDLVATADALHMSASTLQRRLASDGTSFQALKDELRRDLAIVRLNTSTASLATLADELGFADSAAFQRAFKGWTGSAPGAYRRGGP